MRVITGRFVHSTTRSKIEVLADTALGYDEATGEIKFIECIKEDKNLEKLRAKYSSPSDAEWQVTTLSPSQFVMPGMVDTHIHAPQYRFTGTSYDKQLIDWLDTYTFATEVKFKDVEVAKDVYGKVVRRTLSHGTTTASYYATLHLESTKELCRIIGSQGQRALVGKVNMDNPKTCPDYLIESSEDSIKETLELIEFIEKLKNPLIQAVVTPRSAPYCTESTLKRLAEISVEKDIPLQTHLCEQFEELKFTLDQFPPHYKDCIDLFDKLGLLTDKSILAHCIQVEDDQLQILKKRNIGICHCPSSNFCLRSGLMNVNKYLSEDMKLGLGTDVAGGYHPSVFDALRMSIIVSKTLTFNRESIDAGKYQFISHHDAFYMATIGGAQVLNLDDKIGNFKVGKQFDALLIDTIPQALPTPTFDIFQEDSFDDILSKFLYLGDDRNIIRVFVGGKQVVGK